MDGQLTEACKHLEAICIMKSMVESHIIRELVYRASHLQREASTKEAYFKAGGRHSSTQ